MAEIYRSLEVFLTYASSNRISRSAGHEVTLQTATGRGNWEGQLGRATGKGNWEGQLGRATGRGNW